MNEIYLSIIIPHYNSTKSLKRLLVSIPLMEEIQVIVVDDKSCWEPQEWESLQTAYGNVEFYKNESDSKGAGASRNIGLEHATGKWLLFADADDYFAERFWDIVKEYFGSEYDIVYFVSTSVYEETGETAARHLFCDERIQKFLMMPSYKNELLLRYEYEGPCSRLIRRSLVVEHKIGFETVRYANDVMFSMKTANYARKIAADERLIYIITKSKDSLTATINSDSTKIRLDVFLRKAQYLRTVLSKEDFRILNINGLGWLLYIVNHHLGSKMLWHCIRLFRKNRVPLLNYRMFTLPYWIEKYKEHKALKSS